MPKVLLLWSSRLEPERLEELSSSLQRHVTDLDITHHSQGEIDIDGYWPKDAAASPPSSLEPYDLVVAMITSTDHLGRLWDLWMVPPDRQLVLIHAGLQPLPEDLSRGLSRHIQRGFDIFKVGAPLAPEVFADFSNPKSIRAALWEHLRGPSWLQQMWSRLTGVPGPQVSPYAPPDGMEHIRLGVSLSADREHEHMTMSEQDRQLMRPIAVELMASHGSGRVVVITCSSTDRRLRFLGRLPHWFHMTSHRSSPTFETLEWYRLHNVLSATRVSEELEPWAEALQNRAEHRFFAVYLIEDLAADMAGVTAEDRVGQLRARLEGLHRGCNSERPFRAVVGMSIEDWAALGASRGQWAQEIWIPGG